MRKMKLLYQIDAIDLDGVRGWALDKHDKNNRILITITMGDEIIGRTICNEKRTDLASLGLDNTDYGFVFNFPTTLTREELASIKIYCNETPLKIDDSTEHFLTPIKLLNRSQSDTAKSIIKIPGAAHRGVFKITSSSFLSNLLRLDKKDKNIDKNFANQLHEHLNSIIETSNFLGLHMEKLSIKLPDMSIKMCEVSLRNSNFMSVNTDFQESLYGPDLEVQLIVDAIVPDNGVFLDIGANWGFFSFFLALRKNFTGRIHSFEPTTSVFEQHLKLIQTLDLEQTITPHNFALGDENTTLKIYLQASSGLNTLLQDKSTSNYELINTKKLDSLDLPKASLIKIDVEGFEGRVILGALGYIKEFYPPIIFENWSSELADDVSPLNVLGSLGYKFYLPGWQDADLNFFHEFNHASYQFGLLPFGTDDRPQLPERINILALHENNQTFKLS